NRLPHGRSASAASARVDVAVLNGRRSAEEDHRRRAEETGLVSGVAEGNADCIRQTAVKLPYWILATIAVVLLTFRHVRSTGASTRSKQAVVGLTASSVLLLFVWPGALILVLLQLATGAYIVLHQTATSALNDKQAQK